MKKKVVLYSILILLSVVYIFITNVQPVNARYYNMGDDALVIDLANELSQGNWLGDYNSLTLVKGVFAPLFLCITSILNIPFFLALRIFYILACILFISVISKKMKNNFILIVIYMIMLFNPIIYSSELTRIYRESMYASLTLYLVSFILAIFLNRDETFTKKLVKYFVGFGLSFTGMCFCREETIWVAPFVILSSIATILFIVFDKKIFEKTKKILLYLIPICILVVSILVVCTLNYKHYGVFMLNQYWGSDFKEVYGALTRISSHTEYQTVPITREALRKAYEVSPTFRELEKYIEAEDNQHRWARTNSIDVGSEIEGGWIHWIIFEAAKYEGYYKDAKTANEFYRQVGKEINEAIDNGELEGLSYKRVSNTALIGFSDIKDLIVNMKDTMKFQYSFDKVSIRVFPYLNSSIRVEGFEERKEMTHNLIHSEPVKPATYIAEKNKVRLETLEKITEIYQKINPYLFYTSIISFIVFAIICIKRYKELYEELLILGGLLTLYLSRILIVTYTGTFMWKSAININYLANSYVIQLLFSSLTIVFTLKTIVKIVKNKYMKKQD